MAEGTLCRIIPIQVIDGKVVKYRVEHGDIGGCLGVVMYEIQPAEAPWRAYLSDADDAYAEPVRVGNFASAEAAALRLAAVRFAGEPAPYAVVAG